MPIARRGWLSLTLEVEGLVLRCSATALAATLPVLLLFSMPMRELLAHDAQRRPAGRRAPRGASSPSDYPGAIVDLLQADGGFVRDGAWFSAAYLSPAWRCCSLLARGARRERDRHAS